MAMGTFYAIFDKESYNPPKELTLEKMKKVFNKKIRRFTWTFELKA